MSAASQHPTTKVLHSLQIDSTSAHDFLTSFIQNVDVNRHFSNTDLELADQRRIASALEGIYVPKVVEDEDEDAIMEAPAAVLEEEEAQIREIERGIGAETEEETAQAVRADKTQRKLDKKARKQEEKRARAAERARAKNEGS